MDTRLCNVFWAPAAAGLWMTSATDLPGNRRDRIETMSSLSGSRSNPSTKSCLAPLKFCKQKYLINDGNDLTEWI